MREIKKAKSEYENLEPSDVFSAMPPVGSLKSLVRHVMTERVDRRGRILVLAVFDVSRAYFYGVCERDVYVEPPAELHRLGLVAKLNKTMYGTQDASNAWQKLWGEHLRSNGFELSACNPELDRSELVSGFCHGDDFVTAAAEDRIEIFGNMLQDKFDTRRIGMIDTAKRMDKELEVLHTASRARHSTAARIYSCLELTWLQNLDSSDAVRAINNLATAQVRKDTPNLIGVNGLGRPEGIFW